MGGSPEYVSDELEEDDVTCGVHISSEDHLYNTWYTVKNQPTTVEDYYDGIGNFRFSGTVSLESYDFKSDELSYMYSLMSILSKFNPELNPQVDTETNRVFFCNPITGMPHYARPKDSEAIPESSFEFLEARAMLDILLAADKDRRYPYETRIKIAYEGH